MPAAWLLVALTVEPSLNLNATSLHKVCCKCMVSLEVFHVHLEMELEVFLVVGAEFPLDATFKPVAPTLLISIAGLAKTTVLIR